MADRDLARPAFRYSSAGRRPERLNQSRDVNVPVQLARGWAAGLLGLPGDVEGLVRMLPGIRNETPVLPTSDFYREALPGYDPRPAARALSGLGALTGGAGATSVVRGGLGAVKRAADPEAIRQYVRATQGMTGLPGTAVVKPKGGNWLANAGSPEEAVRPLRTTIVGMEPAERIPVVEDVIRQYEAAGEGAAPFVERMRADKQRLTGEAALNQWIDQKLAKYIRNEMGTPEDPVRALAERGVLHTTPEHVFLPSDTAFQRQAAGYPRHGMAKSQLATDWEVLADAPISSVQAGKLAPQFVEAMPWLSKVPPETPVYSMTDPRAVRTENLGFSHLVDELRNAITPNSGLPREMQFKPEQLSRVTMPQAVELVDRINKWRAAQAAAAQRAAREGIPVHKEYPEGYRWLAAPDTADPRALKYVQDVGCEGGWCTQSEAMAQRYGSGKGRQLFVLHDPEGRAVAQVAVKPSGMSPYDAWYRSQKVGSPELQEFERYLNQNRDRLRDIRGEGRQGLEVWYEQWARDTGRPIVQPTPEIVEIKGKQNRAPKEEHLPFIQDFVRSGQWGRIGDIQNTGMRPRNSVFNDNELRQLREAGAGDIPEALAGEDIQRLHNLIVPEGQRLKYDARGNVVGSEDPNYATGGLVSATQYDPARIDALVNEIMAPAA